MQHLPAKLFQIGLLGLCLWYLLHDADFSGVLRALSEFDPLLVAAGIGLQLFAMLPPSLRTRFLLHGRIGLALSYNATMFGMGMNNILPAKLGEISKACYLKTAASIPMARCLGSVFWERFGDLNALLLLGLLAILQYLRPGYVLALGGVVAFLWAMLAVNKIVPRAGRGIVGLLPLPRARRVALEILDHLREFTPSFLLRLGWHTLLTWAGILAVYAFVILHVAGLDISMGQLLVVLTLASLGFALPSSPGSLGVFEAAVVMGLGLSGVGKDQALASALLLRVVQFLPVTAWALALMGLTRISAQQIRKRQAEACGRED
ncbi:lysylphosphatidylglycerol synthase transmembrane domain-containing protein [Desulfohalovibrio reitneri]|uniref:lysylphosphatidylglycerol synthase transmembrane domain-containing protein n=1 Tax=Desulfohalovibrio reitneri TaxID=1307759 RepID=UPI0006905DEF|nr:lysylphosphatidylglycerol synthase transmembrane domain-containing protein [Desulfohalovibrio reitneri]